MQNLSTGRGTVVSGVFVLTVFVFVGLSVVTLFYSASFLVFPLVLVGWIISLALHEYCHAIVAYFSGDATVMTKGYLSLNFLLYMDPINSFLIPILLLILGGIALPGGSVVVSPRNKRWATLTALAGPVSNLMFGFVLRTVLEIIELLLFRHWRSYDKQLYAQSWSVLIFLQGFAFFINLLPFPPLDGWGALEPHINDANPVKRWINGSRWNQRTVMLISFGSLFLIMRLTPLFEYISAPLISMYFLDSNVLASGFHKFQWLHRA